MWDYDPTAAQGVKLISFVALHSAIVWLCRLIVCAFDGINYHYLCKSDAIIFLLLSEWVRFASDKLYFMEMSCCRLLRSLMCTSCLLFLLSFRMINPVCSKGSAWIVNRNKSAIHSRQQQQRKKMRENEERETKTKTRCYVLHFDEQYRNNVTIELDSRTHRMHCGMHK